MTSFKLVASAMALLPVMTMAAAPPADLLPPMPPAAPLAQPAATDPLSVKAAPRRPVQADNARAPSPSKAAAKGPGSDLAAEQFFQNPNPALSEREQAALSIAKRWQEGGSVGTMPMAGQGGAIRFVYGASQPSVVCAVLQICDVELQPGEQVNSLQIGDSERWSVDPAVSGTAPNEVQHLIIKPQDVGLETSLVVATNRRTYHIRLRSHRTDFMPRVAFTYPEDATAKWEALKARETKERTAATIPSTGEYLGDLSFEYQVTGSASWKPVRVYNDGRKTILQMPREMAQTEAPTLLVISKEGGVFTDDETVMVNYRVQGNRYIVDAVFDKAIMIAGVGSGQDRVTIQRGR